MEQNMSRLRQEAKNLDPVLRIGKKGLTESVIDEIAKLLKKRKLIKIKILNNCEVDEKDLLISEITEKTGSILVSKMGNVFSIYKK